MSFNRIYEFGPTTENVVEQIVSIREYRAINRFAPNDRTTEMVSAKMHGKTLLPGKSSNYLKSPDSFTEASPYHSSPVSNNSSEFFDRFYIHDHMRVKSYQAKYKTGFLNRSPLTTTHSSRNPESASTSNHLKTEIYELNTHQVISLKGIRINQKA